MGRLEGCMGLHLCGTSQPSLHSTSAKRA